MRWTLTVFLAAQIGSASGILADDGVMAIDAAVIVRAHVARAQKFAALGLVALVVFALDLGRVRDRSVTAITAEAVAVQVLFADEILSENVLVD